MPILQDFVTLWVGREDGVLEVWSLRAPTLVARFTPPSARGACTALARSTLSTGKKVVYAGWGDGSVVALSLGHAKGSVGMQREVNEVGGEYEARPKKLTRPGPCSAHS